MQASKSHTVKPDLGSRLRSTTLSVAILALLGGATIPAHAIQLYVDTQTQQVFTSPGINRVKLSEFEEVNEAVGKVPPEELKTLETRLRQKKKKEELKATEELTAALTPKQNWSDRISLRGYTQLRYNQPISGDSANLASPGDKFISNNQNFGVRRARVVLRAKLPTIYTSTFNRSSIPAQTQEICRVGRFSFEISTPIFLSTIGENTVSVSESPRFHTALKYCSRARTA